MSHLVFLVTVNGAQQCTSGGLPEKIVLCNGNEKVAAQRSWTFDALNLHLDTGQIRNEINEIDLSQEVVNQFFS